MKHLTALYVRWRYLVLLGTLLLVLVVQPISFGFSTPLKAAESRPTMRRCGFIRRIDRQGCPRPIA